MQVEQKIGRKDGKLNIKETLSRKEAQVRCVMVPRG